MAEKTPLGASSQADFELEGSNAADLTSKARFDESHESLGKMATSHRVETALVNRLFVELFGPLAAQVEASIRWFGTAVETVPPAGDLLQAHPGHLAEWSDALAFYRGKQWPQDIYRQRRADARPVLVVNRLIEIVAASIEKHRRSHALDRDLSDVDILRLQVIVTLANRDAQMLYNYALSALAEQLAAVPRPTVPDAPLEDA